MQKFSLQQIWWLMKYSLKQDPRQLLRSRGSVCVPPIDKRARIRLYTIAVQLYF